MFKKHFKIHYLPAYKDNGTGVCRACGAGVEHHAYRYSRRTLCSPCAGQEIGSGRGWVDSRTVDEELKYWIEYYAEKRELAFFYKLC